MRITRRGNAAWKGGLKDGKGALSTESGALDHYPYGFAARFEGKPGSNPEELLAAAHAGCFTMALALVLTEAGVRVPEMRTEAAVTLEKTNDGFSISGVKLTLNAALIAEEAEVFTSLAHKAKETCPVSKLFNTAISLDIKTA